MRNNGPITDKEVVLAADDEIVSSTDTQGDILFCNDTFCHIAGYTREELINQHHNILRHPHMPKEAFAMLWTALKAGKPWMGMIKNRCKNGDFYWLDAYVTPIRERGTINGTASYRVNDDTSHIASAHNAYDR